MQVCVGIAFQSAIVQHTSIRNEPNLTERCKVKSKGKNEGKEQGWKNLSIYVPDDN